MIPGPFEYVRAESVEHALVALREHGDEAKLLAGGHSLLPLMKLRLAVPSVLVDIGQLRDLSYIRVERDQVAIGATTRHHELETSEAAATNAPLLAHVAGRVGDPQVRHRGTIGGTVAHGDPASDLPAALLAMDAVFVVHGPAGRREIAATEFFHGFFETALTADEMIVEVRVPQARSRPWGYEKFTRRDNDWPIVAAAAIGGRVALANMGGTVLRAHAVEAALADGAPVAEAARLAADGTSPSSDMHADVDYRRHLARLLTRRALESVVES